MDLAAGAPRYVFFTGKGGVGKTSTACATALALTTRGKRVLLVSTDPASNLAEVLGARVSDSLTEVPGAEGLFALNLDPEAAARRHRERIVAPYRGVLPEATVRSIEEQLSGACTVEIAAFDEFSKLLGDRSSTSAFDHVVFDTAPTGHTLRLLELPGAWTNFIETSRPGGASCLGPLAALAEQRELYASTQRALVDPTQTRVVLVARPDILSLAEAERTRLELAALGIQELQLVLNGLFSVTDPSDTVAQSLEAKQKAALTRLPPGLACLPRTEFPLFPFGVVGLTKLRALLGEAVPAIATRVPSVAETHLSDTEELTAQIAHSDAGVILTMGKGGVGKTSIALRIASELRRLGKNVHLTSTDPAANPAQLQALERSGVRVSRIDAAAETRSYAQAVLQRSNLDEAGQRLLEEELRSPCTEEIAVFHAFARLVDQGQRGFVVIDTAPTGHTLLLLDAAEAYHREVSRAAGLAPEAVRELLPRLRDPSFTKILIVTLPEATPVHEAKALQDDLMRAQIRPFAWVINQSLLPLHVTDPTLVARRAAEVLYVSEVGELASKVCIEPFRFVQEGSRMNTVLFACIHNAGRSQMAAAWFNALADKAKASAVSAGTEPGTRVHPEVVHAMREVGIELEGLSPQKLTDELAAKSSILITMGCGEACPYVPGLRRLDWPLEDPKGKPIERVREIRDDVKARVLALLETENWR